MSISPRHMVLNTFDPLKCKQNTFRGGLPVVDMFAARRGPVNHVWILVSRSILVANGTALKSKVKLNFLNKICDFSKGIIVLCALVKIPYFCKTFQFIVMSKTFQNEEN